MESPSPGAAQRLLPGRGRRPVSALNEPVWRLCLIAGVASVLAALLPLLPGRESALGAWIAALTAGLGWLAAVRLLLLDTAVRRFWILWLVVGFGLVALADDPGLAQFTTAAFLLLRRYQPLRHLTSRRRARLFGLACLGLPLVLAAMGLPEEREGLGGYGRDLADYALFSLAFFWIMVLLQLVFRARLHFLRLRPKLAVSAALVALVPLVLVVVLGLLGLYGALGGMAASRGKQILVEWGSLADEDPAVGRALFPRSFSPGEEEPWWSGQLREALTRPGPGSWSPADTTAWVLLGEELWLLRLRDTGGETPRIWGFQPGPSTLDRLGRLTRGRVRLNLRDLEQSLTGEEMGVTLRGSAPPDSSNGLFTRSLPFGGAPVRVLELLDDRLEPKSITLALSTSLSELGSNFVSGENPVNQGLVVALAGVALIFLLVELFALFFGLRIATGITSAVRTLHRGTEELAAGNLEARIEVPNEDEFGDLAESFNEMTKAVKRARDELVAQERLEREIATAREIQKRLLPYGAPALPGYQIQGISQPSRQVGGDYFDFLRLPEGRLGVAVGDVSGKGIPAALLMSNLQASLKGQVLHPGRVSRIVAAVNDLLVASTDVSMFATFFYGELDPPTGDFVCSNAGHDPPLLVRRDGAVERLGTGGLLLGIMEKQDYREQRVRLEEGDVLVLFTDGIPEAQGPLPGRDGEEAAESEDDVNLFEVERLEQVVVDHRHESAERIQEAVLQAVQRHTAGIPQSDDITLVVLKRVAA